MLSIDFQFNTLDINDNNFYVLENSDKVMESLLYYFSRKKVEKLWVLSFLFSVDKFI